VKKNKSGKKREGETKLKKIERMKNSWEKNGTRSPY